MNNNPFMTHTAAATFLLLWLQHRLLQIVANLLGEEEEEAEEADEAKGSNALFGPVISSDLMVKLFTEMNSAAPYGAITWCPSPRNSKKPLRIGRMTALDAQNSRTGVHPHGFIARNRHNRPRITEMMKDELVHVDFWCVSTVDWPSTWMNIFNVEISSQFPKI